MLLRMFNPEPRVTVTVGPGLPAAAHSLNVMFQTEHSEQIAMGGWLTGYIFLSASTLGNAAEPSEKC